MKKWSYKFFQCQVINKKTSKIPLNCLRTCKFNYSTQALLSELICTSPKCKNWKKYCREMHNCFAQNNKLSHWLQWLQLFELFESLCFSTNQAELMVYSMGSFKFFRNSGAAIMGLWVTFSLSFLRISFLAFNKMKLLNIGFPFIVIPLYVHVLLINEVKSKTNNFSVKSKDINFFLNLFLVRFSKG